MPHILSTSTSKVYRNTYTEIGSTSFVPFYMRPIYMSNTRWRCWIYCELLKSSWTVPLIHFHNITNLSAKVLEPLHRPIYGYFINASPITISSFVVLICIKRLTNDINKIFVNNKELSFVQFANKKKSKFGSDSL